MGEDQRQHSHAAQRSTSQPTPADNSARHRRETSRQSDNSVSDASDSAAPLASEIEEERHMIQNLAFIRDFLKDVEDKEVYTEKTKEEIVNVKKQMEKLFNKVTPERNCQLCPDVSKTSPSSKTGAIPKKKIKVETPSESETSTASDDTQSDSSPDTSSSSPSSSEASRNSKRKPKKTQKRKTKPAVAVKKEKKETRKRKSARTSMELKRAPVMSSYNEDSGIDLKSYLEDFEDYCRQCFIGTPRFWIGELESKLSGDTLRQFTSARTADDSWESLKKKMCTWYGSEKLTRKTLLIDRFRDARYKKGETLFSLAMRTEQLFKAAYPKKSVKYSQTLREKFVSVIPSRFREAVENQIIMEQVNNKKVKWDKVKNIATVCEVNKKHSRPEEEEIVINVGTRNPRYERPYYDNGNREYVNKTRYDSDNNFANFSSRRNNLPQLAAPPSDSYDDQRPSSRPSMQRFSAPPQHLAKNNVKCFYCHRLGHIVADCRFRNNTCFSCGSQGHYVVNCPQTSQSYQSRNNDSVRRNRAPSADERTTFSRRDTRRNSEVNETRRNSSQPSGNHYTLAEGEYSQRERTANSPRIQ